MLMLLPLKLILTPLLIASITLVGRRWGPGISGWLMGFPLTSGPVSILLALQYGRSFAGSAAVGSMGGMASSCVFCLVYTLVSRSAAWPVSAGVSVLAFFFCIFCWNFLSLSLLPTFGLSVVIIALILRLIPRKPGAVKKVSSPRWDMPARMAAAAAFVLLLTTAASSLGPQLSGLLSPFPIFTLVIASFTQHQQGPDAASQLLRGIVLGSFAFNSFFLVVGLLLPATSMAWAYTLAIVTALAVNSTALRFLNPGQGVLPEG